jgi:hypothetical protein
MSNLRADVSHQGLKPPDCRLAARRTGPEDRESNFVL